MTRLASPPAACAQAASGARELSHAEALRGQWNFMRALEQLDEGAAALVSEAASGEKARLAAHPLAPLAPWPGLSEEHDRAYQREHNVIRMQRVLDFCLPGDRIFDVGCGYGYVGGLVLKYAAPSHYSGIDRGAHCVTATREMLRANGLTHIPSELAPGDLFQIDRELMKRARPDLLLLLEVTEHLTDPVAALRSVMRDAPDGAALLFTVPFAGRLEDVTGHVSFFNADRLQSLCEQADLEPHWAEPICNRWSLVLASNGGDCSERVLNALRRRHEAAPTSVARCVDFSTSTAPRAAAAGGTPAAADLATLTFEPASFSADTGGRLSHWRHRTQSRVRAVPAHNPHALRCEIVGSDDTSGEQYGGVQVEIAPPRAILLTIELDSPENIRMVFVDGYDLGRRRTLRWVWDASKTPIPAGPLTVCLVPGQSAGGFRAATHEGAGETCEAHVFVSVSPGAAVALTLHRLEVARLGPSGD